MQRSTNIIKLSNIPSRTMELSQEGGCAGGDCLAREKIMAGRLKPSPTISAIRIRGELRLNPGRPGSSVSSNMCSYSSNLLQNASETLERMRFSAFAALN